MARAGIDQFGELLKDLDHLVGTLAAGHDDNYVGIGLLRDRVLKHRLTRTERSGDEARTALGQRVESVDGPHARLHDARGARLLPVTAHGLLHGPPLNHRNIVIPTVGIGDDGDRVRNLVLSGGHDALDRIGSLHREGYHDLVLDPLLLDLAQPRCGRNLVAGLGQRLELPLLLEVDRVGDRTARDEQTVHLLQVVLQTVVVARKKTGSERRFQHVTLEFDLFADLQSAGRVENLHVGIVAHDLDDLGHHLGIPAVNVTDFVLADRAVRLHDHDVRDDTVYSSCCFHYLFYCLLIKSLPSRLVIRRCSISRPCLSSKQVQRATMFTFTR